MDGLSDRNKTIQGISLGFDEYAFTLKFSTLSLLTFPSQFSCKTWCR
jgi:hypothetical protein